MARYLLAPHTVSKMVGQWTWAMLLWRPSLSNFDALYHYAGSQSRAPMYFNDRCRGEILLAVCSAPMLWCDLTQTWSELFCCTDASEYGFGGVHCPVGPEVAKEIGHLSERRGDYITLDSSERAGEAAADEAEATEDDGWQDWRPWVAKKTRGGVPHRLPFGEWDFKIHLKGEWGFEAHINGLEPRAVWLHVRWLSRSERHHNKRHPLGVDSKVVLFVVAKGRSSSKLLGPLCRKIAATCAYAGIRLYPVWIPTAENPSDPPSRGGWLTPFRGPGGGVPWPPEVLQFLSRVEIPHGGLFHALAGDERLSAAHLNVDLAACTLRLVGGLVDPLLAREALVKAVAWGQPGHVVLTLSSATFHDKNGELARYRGQHHPWGRPGLPALDHDAVHRGNRLAQLCADLTNLCLGHKLAVTLCATMNSGVWTFPTLKTLLEGAGSFCWVGVAMCAWGARRRRATWLATTAQWLQVLETKCRCSGSHAARRGELTDEEEFPERLAHAFAEASLGRLNDRQQAKVAGRARGRLPGRGILRRPLTLLMMACLCVCGAGAPVEEVRNVGFEGERPLRYVDLAPVAQTKYSNALGRFTKWLRASALHPTTVPEYDDALELYINEQFKAGGGRRRQRAVEAYAAVMRRWPRLHGQLRASFAALRAWQKKVPSRSYRPLSWGQTLAMVHWLQQQGWVRTAVALLLMSHGMLRVEELLRLPCSDLLFRGRRAHSELACDEDRSESAGAREEPGRGGGGAIPDGSARPARTAGDHDLRPAPRSIPHRAADPGRRFEPLCAAFVAARGGHSSGSERLRLGPRRPRGTMEKPDDGEALHPTRGGLARGTPDVQADAGVVCPP